MFNQLYTHYTLGSQKRKEQGVLHRFKNGESPYLVSNKSVSKKGVFENDVWQIPFVAPSARERIGYPTQKPLALLTRIVTASSAESDIVLDPFCGCATSCIAAETLGRQWTGIDISSKAAELVKLRMHKEVGIFYHGEHRTDIPIRTDIGQIRRYNHPENKQHLYGKQSGNCAGCKDHFEARHLEIDHIVPKSRAGTDHLENLQLLCGSCNRIKGNRPQEYLLSALNDSSLIKLVA